MCGIAGFLNKNTLRSKEENLVILSNMTNILRHRGPDGTGLWLNETGYIALGHTRLAIIDLAATGAQPMRSSCGRYVISFNGEIYNYQNLRQSLNDISLRGSSDTEILLELIARNGVSKTLERTNGMFAFALWDEHTRTLTLARDRIGQKPLYYFHSEQALVFASELKAIQQHPSFRKEINRGALNTFTRYGYIPDPASIWAGIKKLPAGTFIQVNADKIEGGLTPVPYWTTRNAFEDISPKNRTAKEIRMHLKDLLRQAVGESMVSDVPLGGFLSGGIDSSLIVAMMQEQSTRKVQTFSIGFSDKIFDEAPHARAIAAHLNTHHTELYVTAKDLLEVIPRLPEIYDEPFGDISQIPTFLMCRLARQKVTVCLSGDGGDELFGGYTRYDHAERIVAVLNYVPHAMRLPACRFLQRLPLSWGKGKLQRLGYIMESPAARQAYIRLLSSWPRQEPLISGQGEDDNAALCPDGQWTSINDFRMQMQVFDIECYLPGDILTKMDRASMANSLEVRVPLLDHRVMEFALSLPGHLKWINRSNKRILRDILGDYVPVSLYDRPKKGFDLPLASWLRGDLRDWAEELLAPERLKHHGLLNVALIREIWQAHLQGKSSLHYPLWNILVLQSWLSHQKI